MKWNEIRRKLTDNMQGEHVDRSEGGGPAQKRTNTERSRAVPIALGLAEGGKAIIKKAQKRCLGIIKKANSSQGPCEEFVSK